MEVAMKKITKIGTSKLENTLNLRQGWQIEGIKFAADPCASPCMDECASKCDMWSVKELTAWGPSSKLINTWLTCPAPQPK